MKKLKKILDNQVLKNTTMLYIMNITKLVLPLLTLPYLTRIFSVEAYGVSTYVKSIMSYMQLIIDFGFILSATKDVVRAKKDMKKIGRITGNVIVGKLLLSGICFIFLVLMSLVIPILKQNFLFTLLSFVPVVLTTFLLDFLFRGLEQMNVITYRFLIMKGISTALTFIVVKNDGDLLLIPILDIIGTLVAIIWINSALKKMGLHLSHGKLKEIFSNLKESFNYFLSNIATTAFSALNTVVIGIVLSKSDVAYWSIAMQVVNAVHALYDPILDGIYPEMVRDKKVGLIKKVLLIFTPLIVVGCGIVLFGSNVILFIIGGAKYASQGYLLQLTIPVLFFSFYSMLFGWPVLGAIDKVKQTTATTIAASLIQIVGLFLLILIGQFNLISLSILRGITEFSLLFFRLIYCWKYRAEFSDCRFY